MGKSYTRFLQFLDFLVITNRSITIEIFPLMVSIYVLSLWHFCWCLSLFPSLYILSVAFHSSLSLLFVVCCFQGWRIFHFLRRCSVIGFRTRRCKLIVEVLYEFYHLWSNTINQCDDRRDKKNWKSKICCYLFEQHFENINQQIKKNLKLQHTLIFPIATYGSECWTLRKKTNGKISFSQFDVIEEM